MGRDFTEGVDEAHLLLGERQSLLRGLWAPGILATMVSSHDLTRMPDLAGFRRLTRSLAVLDAVMSPQWEYRYYSFDPSWGDGEMMASMRDGSGDHWFAVLCTAGAALVGLAHESPGYKPGEPHPGVFAGLPEVFDANLRQEPAFETSNATFCVWRLWEQERWHSGASTGHELPRKDGSAQLLSILEGRPEQYKAFAEDYFEREIGLADVAAVYEHQTIDRGLITRLNPEADVAAVEEELRTLGYPES